MRQLPAALLLHLLQGQVLIDNARRFALRTIFFIVLFAVNEHLHGHSLPLLSARFVGSLNTAIKQRDVQIVSDPVQRSPGIA